MKRYRKYFLIALLPLIIVGGIWFSKWRHTNDADVITTYGNVDIRQVELGFRVSGRISKMPFEEGDFVKEGDVVAILDQAPYISELNSAKAQVALAEADYAKKLIGNRPEEIQQARSIVEEREATLKNAIQVYERQAALVKSGTASRQVYDNAIQQKQEAEARLMNAKNILHLMEAGYRKEDIAAAKATLDQAKAQLAATELRLQDTEIKSPTDGTIFSRVREVGAIVAAGATVYTLSLPRPVWIRAYVTEPELGLIKPGDEVFVYTDSSEVPFKGKIGFISPQAEFTPKNVETLELRTDLVFRIRIVVDDPEGRLRQGLPVTVRIPLKHDK